MKRTLLMLTLLATALGGCTTHQKQSGKQIGDISPSSFQKSWTVATGLQSISRSYLDGKMLFLYGADNTVAAFSTDGVPMFRTPVGEKGDLIGPPILAEDRVIFPTSGGFQFLTFKGIITRTLPLDQPPRSPGVLFGPTIFLGTDSSTGGRIAAVALDRNYNIYRWTLLTGIVRTQPVLHNGGLYAATEDGRVVALNLDRAQFWPVAPELPDGIFHTDGQIIAAIKVDDAGVYVPSTDTKLYCLDPVNGRVKWEYFSGTPINESPIATADMVYIHIRGKGIVALPKKTTQRINMPAWNYPNATEVLGDDATYAYLLDTSGQIVAIEKSSGNLKFTTKRNDFVHGITHVDPKDSTLYVLTKSNDLIAVSPVLKTGVVGELVMNDTPGLR